MAVIALDFDGTVCTHEYPKVGRLLPGVQATIQALKENGHKIFLWTMRDKEQLLEAREFLVKNGMEINSFNYSPNQFSTSPKQHANLYIDDATHRPHHLYIDDAACGCPLCSYWDTREVLVKTVDWRRVAKWLHEIEYISYEQYTEIKDGIDRTYRAEGRTYSPYSI